MAALNERHGYKQIDALLAGLGSLIRDSCGGRDFAARVGGDEFALGLVVDELDEAIHARKNRHCRASVGASGPLTPGEGVRF